MFGHVNISAILQFRGKTTYKCNSLSEDLAQGAFQGYFYAAAKVFSVVFRSLLRSY